MGGEVKMSRYTRACTHARTHSATQQDNTNTNTNTRRKINKKNAKRNSRDLRLAGAREAGDLGELALVHAAAQHGVDGLAEGDDLGAWAGLALLWLWW